MQPSMTRSSALLLVLLSACAGPSTTSSTGSTSSSSSSTGGAQSSSEMPDAGPSSLCEEPTPVTCEDQVIQQLNLQDTVSPAAIENMNAEGVFTTHVDATAGGFNANPPQSYVYARFTADGLEKVDVSDEDALSSMDWDIAFRRYVIRINSGASGPSCVRAVRTPPATSFDTLAEVPSDFPWRKDEMMTETCEFVSDGSGLPSSPLTALASYYTYSSCVEMSGNVFVLELRNGKHVKLVVTAYYNESVQEQCNTSHQMPAGATGSGNIRFKWAFLD